MALNNISFVLGQGGLGRPLPGEDYISGLIFYTAGSLPSGFNSSNRVKQIFSVLDAEAAGIVNDYADSTAACGTYLITTKGNTGDTIQLTYTNSKGIAILLGVYTVGSGDTTIALQGAAWAALISAGYSTHGCLASFATATLTVALPGSEGVFPNTGTPFAVALTGAFAGTLTQPAAATQGVASKFAVWHYHISEYFRLQPQGNLYVGIFAVPNTYTFSEIITVQNFSGGKIRQIGIYKDSAAFASADLTAIDIVCKSLGAAHKEIIALYAADISSVTNLSTLADLSQLTANTASPIIAQDGGAAGAQLYKTTGKSITTLGAALGAVAFAAVNESIAWVQKFNISNGTECDVVAFANGTLFTDASITDALLTQLQNSRYIFLRKFVGTTGSYFNENSTAIAATSDYAYIADNRTIQKATRGIYTSLLPSLNSPILLNANGTISDVVESFLTTEAESNLQQMVRDSELSGYEVVINTKQNVLSTGKLVVTVNLLQTATARNIQVNIGFNVSIN